jgi:polyhydroxybutyrate depolymerase
MNNQNRICILLLIILSVNSFSFAQSGKLHELSFMHDDSLRSYSIYVPPAYDGETKWPLVINFHGYTSNITDQIARSKMNIRADTAHYLVAYPQGLEINRSPDILPVFVTTSGTGWSVPGFSSEYNDIDFTEKVIDQIISDYSVDISRIHTTGLSLGGYMAFYVASQLPDRIASVAGVAGHLTSLVQKNMDQNRAISAMFVHGDDDKIIFYNGVDGQYPSIPEAASFWAGIRQYDFAQHTWQ